MTTTGAQLLTAAQAAWLTHHNERAVRWRVHRGDLPFSAGEDGHMRVALDDLERIPGWRVDSQRLDELQRRDTGMVATLEARISALESRVRVLESRQTAVRPIAVPPHTPYLSNNTDEPVSASPRRAPVDALPDGLMGTEVFALAHGLAPTTVSGALADGRLPFVEGSWKRGDRGIVRRALTREAHAVACHYWEIVNPHPNFRRCSDCPPTALAAYSVGSAS